MNKKRTISIRHPQLIKFRNTLREVIFRFELVEIRKLMDKRRNLNIDDHFAQLKDLSDKIDRLETAWKSSLCTCPLCGSRTSDMTFNADTKRWFCVSCYRKNQEFYVIKAREGQIWNAEDGSPSTKWWL